MTTQILAKVLESAGGEEEFDRKRQQYTSDLAYFENNQKQLLKNHDDNWVAIYGNKVVAYSKNYDALITQLKKEGIPENEAVIKFVCSRDIIALFIKQ